MSGDDLGKNSEDSRVIDVQSDSIDLTFKQKAGDAANEWLAKNRSLVLRQTPVWAQALTAALIGLGGIVVLGGILFRIDEVVSVQGQLKSIGGTMEVKTPAGGRVQDVFFADGQQVKKGELLVRFDTRQALAEKKLLTSQIELETIQLKKQLSIYKSQDKTLKGQQDVLNQRLQTKESILREMKSLVEQGGFQKIQYLEQQDQVFGLRKQLADIEEQRSRLDLESERLVLQTQKSIDRMNTDLQRAELQLQYQNVLSPADGIVFDPQASPEGVLSGGQRILSIVPQKGLYAEVYVPNKDIGFVTPSQQAKVRVDAFPFSRYGEIPAKVIQIAADALPPSPTRSFYSFPVKLELEKPVLESRGVSIPLKAGMAVTTNLKLRDKRLISLFSDIFVDQTDSIRSIRQQ